MQDIQKSQTSLKHYLTPQKLILYGGIGLSAFAAYKYFRNSEDEPKIHIPNQSKRALIPIKKSTADIWYKIIHNLSYEVSFVFLDEVSYQGKVIIKFDMAEVIELDIPYHGDLVTYFSINKTNIAKAVVKDLFKDQSLKLEKKLLKLKNNVIEVRFMSRYHKDSSGLTLAKDYDESVYMYSFNEPCFTHTVFPCFDVPAMRAPFTLRVISNLDKKIISNSEVFKTKLDSETKKKFSGLDIPEIEKLKFHEFKITPPIAPYQLAIICGDFYKTQEEIYDDRIKINLYCKQSLKNLLDEQREEIMETIKSGLDFFEKFLGVKYPFLKYDQIYCPNTTSIALEQPGAVAFNDDTFLFRFEATWNQRLRRAYICLHEMAHMWFGNLVTLRWFSDNWLKESFASVLGYTAFEHEKLNKMFPNAKEHMESYKEPGIFYDMMKNCARAMIRETVDTEDALADYDDVIYHKGCGVLNVLRHRMGSVNFQKFLKKYLEEFSWRSSCTEDFLNILRSFSKKNELPLDIDDFFINWIQSPGTDTIFSSFKGENFHVSIKRPDEKIRREHVFTVAILHQQKTEYMTLKISRDDDSVFIPFENADAILLDVNYEDYGIHFMDEKTINYFLLNFHSDDVDQSLLNIFWRRLCFMTKLKKFDAKKLSEILIEKVKEDFDGKEINFNFYNKAVDALESTDETLLNNTITEIYKICFEKERVKNADKETKQKIRKYVERHVIFKEILLDNIEFLDSNLIKLRLKTEINSFNANFVEKTIDDFGFYDKEKQFKTAMEYYMSSKNKNEMISFDRIYEASSILNLYEFKHFMRIIKSKEEEFFNSENFFSYYLQEIQKIYDNNTITLAMILIDELSPSNEEFAKNLDKLKSQIANLKRYSPLAIFLYEKLDRL